VIEKHATSLPIIVVCSIVCFIAGIVLGDARLCSPHYSEETVKLACNLEPDMRIRRLNSNKPIVLAEDEAVMKMYLADVERYVEAADSQQRR
jgi:hypothetical protein